MVIKKSTIEKVRKIIDLHHKYLLVTMIGKKNMPPEVLKELQEAGFNTEYHRSYLETAYYHNWLNQQTGPTSPTSTDEMHGQQQPHALPVGEAHKSSIDYLNSNLTQLIDKQRAEVGSRIEGFIQHKNNEYKFNALQNLDRPESLDAIVKETSVGDLKRQLRDTSKDAARNWSRIVNTEVSNAISLGSADRIVADNRNTPADEVYVYRIVVLDSALCKYCRKFYLDDDGTPRVYKLATILSNGSNFGKKSDQWLPVAMATHPNERCSQLIELKPGWRALKGGGQTYIGLEAWRDYIYEKVTA